MFGRKAGFQTEGWIGSSTGNSSTMAKIGFSSGVLIKVYYLRRITGLSKLVGISLRCVKMFKRGER